MPHRREEISKALFGSEKRLAILAAIARADDDDCFPTHIAEESGAAQGATSTLMNRLVGVGLLTLLPSRQGDTLKRHRKTESALWGLAEQLYDELSS